MPFLLLCLVSRSFRRREAGFFPPPFLLFSLPCACLEDNGGLTHSFHTLKTHNLRSGFLYLSSACLISRNFRQTEAPFFQPISSLSSFLSRACLELTSAHSVTSRGASNPQQERRHGQVGVITFPTLMCTLGCLFTKPAWHCFGGGASPTQGSRVSDSPAATAPVEGGHAPADQ